MNSQRVWKKSYLHDERNRVNDVIPRGRRNKPHSLQEVTLGVSRVNTPPVVGEHVEHAQDEDEESGRPFGLEADGNHPTCTQTHDRHKHSSDAPLSLNDESQKEEDEQDAAGKKEAANQRNPLDMALLTLCRGLCLTISFGRFR